MKTQKILLTLLITVLCASVSTAQIADKKVLTLDGAKHVIAAAEAQARQLNAPSAVIAVVTDTFDRSRDGSSFLGPAS